MKTALTLLFVLFLCGPATAQDLPPDILADQYLLEATKALENGDPQGALRAFGRIEALDTEPPLEFLFFYGKLLVENSTALEDLLKGQSLLKQFVLNIEKDSEHYTQTLELLLVVGTKLEKSEAERRAEAERQARARAQFPQLFLHEQMVHVQGGTFTMGCTPEQGGPCDENKNPPHQVRVSNFEIGKYEVTQALWEAVMGENPSYFKGCPLCPVEQVSWYDTQEFIQKLNAELDVRGGKYRLPTEAEWEYAARGNLHNPAYKYAEGDELDLVAWYDVNSGDKTHPVGQKEPNGLGLYDMAGNVGEWVQDWYDPNNPDMPSEDRARHIRRCFSTSTGFRLVRSASTRDRAYRGGNWSTSASYLNVARRRGDEPYYAKCYVGFRLARTP